MKIVLTTDSVIVKQFKDFIINGDNYPNISDYYQFIDIRCFNYISRKFASTKSREYVLADTYINGVWVDEDNQGGG